MSKRFLILTLILAATLGLAIGFAHPVLAQTSDTGVDLQAFAEQAGFSTTATVPVIIARLIRTLLTMLGIVVLCLILYGGFVWMTAGGNAERVEKAKRILTNAVIGLIIILASFAITQFILSALGDATGGSITGDGSGSGGCSYCGDAGGAGDQFVLTSINTDCAEIRNMELQMVFSKTVRSSSVDDGGILVEDSAGSAVDGTFSVSGKKVTFLPSAVCEDNAAYTCYDADADYSVNLVSGTLQAEGGTALTCSTSYPCTYDFHTGSALDTAAPTLLEIDSPEDGASVIVASIEKLWALSADDVGLSTVDFQVDGDNVFTAGLADTTEGALSANNSFFTDDTQWDSAGYVTNQSYDIWADGSDCAGNDITSSRIAVTVRAANCGNGTLDADFGETGVDCGGDSNSEFYCGSCDGDSCVSDAECASGACVNGVCATVPEITDVSPNDGADGNLVTISGSGFGSAGGTITFLGTESGDEQTASAYECSGAAQWSDDEIIVQVPDGTVDGPISVTTSGGDIERTDDDWGPTIGDFDANAISRPGICSVVDPDTGLSTTIGNSAVSITGIRFGGTQGTSTVYFTNYQADDYISWADELLSAVVPLLNAGSYRTQVFTGDFVCLASDGTSTGTICGSDDDCDASAGESCASGICSETGAYCTTDGDCEEGEGTCESLRQGSNKVSLTLTSESASEAPVISYTDSGWTTCDDGTRCAEDSDCTDGSSCSEASNWGPPGQYVSIYGSGFGTATGTVYFVSQADDSISAIGSTDFSEACTGDYWGDEEVTIKLPSASTVGSELDPGAYSLHITRAEDGAVSNTVDFELVDGVPGPAICGIDPSAGPEGTEVEIAGDNFGAGQGTVTFYDAIESESATTIWDDQTIGGVVPTGAATGPVDVTDEDGYGSNSVNFTVGDCNEDASICSEGTECCSDGSCSASCETNAGAAHYAYLFSTADIPETPRVIVQCGDWDSDGNNDGVSPSPWEGWSDPEDICLNAAVTATFSVDMNETTLSTDNIAVQPCTGSSDDPCSSLGAELDGAVSTTATGFVWEPTEIFDASTTYQVTLNGGEEAGAIQSADGAYMDEDYAWQFTTSSSSDPCEIGAVAVSPSEHTATEEGEHVNYLAYPTAANDECVALSCSAYDWTWSADQDGAVLDNTSVTGSCSNGVTAASETTPGDPAEIEATVEAENAPSDTGELTIDFTDPEITGYVPNCDAACINANIVVTFNTFMDRSTLTSANVALYKCSDAICEDGLSRVSATLSYSEANPAAPTLTINPVADLSPSTTYRIFVSGDALSSSGVPLSMLPSDCTETGDPCTFQTSSSAEVCDIDHITLSPSEAAMTYVGERQEFDASAYGQPDDCSAIGQILDTDAYTWSAWDAADDPGGGSNVAFMLPSPSDEGNLELTDEMPEGCSSSCLRTGSAIGSGDAVCGNGTVETGEDCDDGNTSEGDGCSSICLHEGTDPVSEGGLCGNGVIDTGEDCDGGVACSDDCLNLGTSALSDTFAECGDGTVDWSSTSGGEDCDDGNDDNFDGCSANCLNEGSTPEGDVYSTCGDGVVEYDAGEDCDDGNTSDGDGCSSICLNEGGECDPDTDEGCTTDGLWAGSSPFYEEASFCGDGIVGTGEECDATDLSAAAVGPYGVAEVYGNVSQEVDAEGFAYSVVSTEAGGETGTAELSVQCSCESDAACGSPATLGCGSGSCCYPRPTQTNANPPSGDTDVCLNAAIWAEFSLPMDVDSFDLSSDANGNGRIDAGEYDPEMYLQLVNYNGSAVSTSCPTDATDAGYVSTLVYNDGSREPVGNVFARAWRWVSNGVARLFGSEASAHQQTTANICLVPVTYSIEPTTGGGSKVYMHYDGVLLQNAQYYVNMEGEGNTSDAVHLGVQSEDGVGVNITLRRVTSFTTGTEICALEQVDVEDLGRVEALTDDTENSSIGLFTQINEEHTLKATPYTIRSGNELEEITGTTDYDWAFAWGSSIAGSSDDNVVDVTEDATDETRASAVAAGANGSETAIAAAVITTDNLNDPSTDGDFVTGDVSLTALLCENPWPAVDEYPYNESTLNYTFYYCRDAGAEGTSDDLPDMTAVEVPHPLSGIYKEFLYEVEGTGDALGVRVVTDEGYLPPDLWYVEQGFTGSPQDAEVDGYQAVRDGNTYYVLTANQTGAIYPNITIISYNDEASAESQDIFDQIIGNWSFNSNTDVVTDFNLCAVGAGYAADSDGNLISCEWDANCIETCVDSVCSVTGDTCSTDADCPLDDSTGASCDAQKAKLTRDTKRLSDIIRLQAYIDAYGESNGHCSVTTDQSCSTDADCTGGETCEASVPQLESGSYLRGASSSAWPSWASGLGNDLGTALPEDPINAFLNCPDGYDGDSCFNGTQGVFQCPEGSHVYGYRSVGLEGYRLYTQLEYDRAPWAYDVDTSSTDNVTIFAEYQDYAGSGPIQDGFETTAVLCDGAVHGDSAVCGDGLIGTDEDCELGDYFTQTCTDEDGTPGVQNYACSPQCQDDPSAVTPSECIPYSCGNGVVEAENGEECDDGDLNGTYGHCSEDCLLAGTFSCGDGYLAGSEACDCGSTADFTSIMADGDSWASINGCGAANGQYATDMDESCAFDCSFPGPSCGDEEINGDEECDGDYEEWAGALCADKEPCSLDSDCTDGSSCGDGRAACGTGNICEDYADEGEACDSNSDCDSGSCASDGTCSGASDVGDKCSSDSACDSGSCSDFTYDLIRYRTCHDPSDANACQWASWSYCVAGGQICGNGIVEGDEACDDGNDSNNDECLNTCELNVCGDDYVYTGVESCDDGDENGQTCDADYGGSCSSCSVTCQYTISSGEYCGDGIRNGTEACDGSDVPYHCFNFAGGVRDEGDECDSSEAGTQGSCPTGYTCREVGVCNGGDYNGEACTRNEGANGSYYQGQDKASCGIVGSGHTCVKPACASDCGSSCPSAFDTSSVLVQSEEAGASVSDTVDLYSYLSGETPDNGVIYIPECTVGTQLIADVSLENVIPPTVDIVFVTDLSGSMQSCVDGTGGCSADAENRRIDYVVSATEDAIGELLDTYSASSGTMRIGLVSFGSSIADDDDDNSTDGAQKDEDFTTDQSDLVAAVEGYLALGSQGGTPTGAGLERAVEMFEDEEDAGTASEVQIIVLLSDGEPTYDFDDVSCSTTTCVEEIADYVEGLGNIKVFSAAIASSDDLIGYMAHFSSDTCGNTYTDVGDCEPNEEDLTEYAYQAQDEEGIAQMYDSIIDAILGLKVSFTTEEDGSTEVTIGAVREGSGVVMPFPDGFDCTGSSFTIPLRVNFNGTGTATLGNFELTNCPAQ